MIIEMGFAHLSALVKRQLSCFFHFDNPTEGDVLNVAIEHALKRTEYCFSNSSNKYYIREGQTYFNPYHSGQYCIFLYYLSNTLWHEDKSVKLLADRVYYLNKVLNSIDLFYEVELPDIFFLDHPVGTVMGRATYGNHFVFAQNCTVGHNKGHYPIIGENVQMMANSMILGNCVVGNNVIIAARTYIKDTPIPNNCIVFGTSPNIVIKEKDESYFAR